MNDELLRRVTAVAHECWVAQMLSEGWSYGPAYDEDRKLHDAMVSFDELPKSDQRAALLCARTEELGRSLAEAIEHARGPDRPFQLSEMHEGRRVALVHGPRMLGSIVGWDIEGGELENIRVRWDDGGKIAEVNPWLQALARPEEEPAQ